MQQIQISRGKLSVKNIKDSLLNGELFIDYTNGKKYDEYGNANSYELYAGVNGQAIKLAGQGGLSFIRALKANEGLPENPIAGGIYYVTEDIDLKDEKDPSGKNNPEFRAGDLAIYVGEKFYASGVAKETWANRFEGELKAAPGWIRVNNGGGDAYEVTFDPINTNFTATNVQEALVEVDRHKLAYGGIKFGKNITAAEKDLTTNKKSNYNTGTESCVIQASDIFNYVDAGYYYSVGELAANTNITIVPVGASSNDEEKVIILEEGDFLAVTSNVTTNDKPLTVSDVTFTKIAGGTHDAGRINYQAGDRASTYKNSSDKAWDTEDGNVKNVKEALDDLFKSKADLSANGKILLTQLPDTLINSMEFQGSFIIKSEEGSEPTFKLPTFKDKINHTDETQESTDKELVQGDYWVYSGPQFKLAEQTAGENVDSSEGYINSGDWLVYNGDGKWSVIDNTSPIQSISLIDDYHNGGAQKDTLTQETINGDILFKGTSRGEDRNKKVISEVQIGTDHKSSIELHVENAALISDENKGKVNDFYKENGSKTLVKTGVSETDNGQLIFNEANGVQFTGGATVGRDDGFDGTDGKKYNKGDVVSANIVQNPEQGSYGNIDLLLPSRSGTIARLEDVGLNNGTNFFIPRYKLEKDGNKSLVDSPIELIDNVPEEGDSESIIGIKFHSSKSALSNDASIIFRKADHKSIQIMPKYSGFILNSNSIIDCGEWTDNGLILENEGKQNTKFGFATTINTDFYYNGIKEGKIPSNTLTESALEEMDVVITKD